MRTNVAPAARRPSMIARQRVERARRPGVEQDDGAVAHRRRRGPGRRRPSPGRSATAPSPRARRRRRRRGSRAPPASPRTRGSSSPAENGQRNHGRGSTPVASRIDRLGVADVGRQPVVGQERQAGVVEAVVPDEVALVGDAPRERGLGLHPAALEEPRRRDAALRQHVEEAGGHARPVRPVGVLGVEREGDAERRRRLVGRAHFSTPVTTTPRTNTRWKTRNRITGITIVIRVPACT